MVRTMRPAATIGTGHTPPDRGARTTALSDRETRRTQGQTQASSVRSVLACSDFTVRNAQHAHTSSSQCHTLPVPRVDQAVPHGRHQTVRQHRHARRHRVQDEYEFVARGIDSRPLREALESIATGGDDAALRAAFVVSRLGNPSLSANRRS